jgi:hypothetical protein
MRANLTVMRSVLVYLSLLIGLGMSSCASEDIEPVTNPCDTNAVVRLCPGNTAVCLTEHTTLLLDDGTLLRPQGTAWQESLPNLVDGQRVQIGFTLGSAVNGNGPGDFYATLNCFQLANGAGEPE